MDPAEGRETLGRLEDKDASSPLKHESNRTGASSPMRGLQSRSTSPAKRTASQMDSEQSKQQYDDRMDIDGSKDRGQSTASVDETSTASSISDSIKNSSGDATDSSSSTLVDSEPAPSLDQQVAAVVAQISNREEEEGLVGYVISRKWLGRVVARSKYNEEMGPFDKDSLEGEIGPVDNSTIIAFDAIDNNLRDEAGKAFVPLKKGLVLDQDIFLLPEASWNQIVKWYGLSNGQHPILRYQHSISQPGSDLPSEYQFELYPPTFILRKLVSEKATNGADKLSPAPRILASTSQRYVEFLRVVKRQLGIATQTKIKVARVVELQAAADTASSRNTVGMPSPPASREASPTRSLPSTFKILGTNSYKVLEDNGQIDLLDWKDETMNEKYNGSSTLDTLGLKIDQTLIISEESSKQRTGAEKRFGNKSGLAKDIESAPSSGRASPAGMMTRGRHQTRNGRPRGSVGLTNLGNTCYMNSALQCMRACQELTTFFISNSFKKELNPDNPIGHRGQVASSYAGLLHEIYDKSQTSVAPRAFKNTLGRYAPMFSGYGQQDSQEFMSFLVDGLHEDLNRVKKKPYRENPDSDDATVHDPEAIRKLGEVFKDNHRARNSSIITDLFNGFYKNKLVCPECAKISITFDPFSLLTLQLPMEHYWEYTFTFFPLHDKPFKIRIDNSKGQTVKDLKECAASKIPGLDAKRLLLVELFSHKVYRVMEDRLSIAEANMLANDDMVFYELEDVPTNFPPKQRIRSMLDVDAKKDHDTSENDVQLVSVLYRLPSQYGPAKNLVLYPSFITLKQAEINDPTQILRKLLQNIANMTDCNLLDLVREEQAAFQADQDGNESDSIDELQAEDAVDRSGIKTRSLASDSYVDVSMDGSDSSPSNLPTTKAVYPFLADGADIPAVLEELFKIHIGNAGEVISLNNYSATSSGMTGQLPLLSSRLPKPPREVSSDDSVHSPAPTDASEGSNTDDTEKDSDAQMSYDANDQESDISFENHDKPGSGRNIKKFKNSRGKHNQKKYGKHSRFNKRQELNKRQEHNMRKTSEEPDSDTRNDGTLIRPNDFLTVDWTRDVFEKLFKGDENGHVRKGCRTFEDEELESRRLQRESRRKKGVALEDCFAETSKEEILTEENAWYCGNCKERRQASKKLEIWTSPDILVIHLKRFSSGRMFRDKIDVLVDFPVEGLYLAGRVGVDEGKPLIYDLFAVDNHYGGLGGGHYTAYAKNFFDGEWYEYNDSSVSKCQAQSVVTRAAYLLFYRRRSEHPLGTPDVQKMVYRYIEGEEVSDSASDRSSSPNDHSGNGSRPTADSLSRNGLPDTLVGPVAVRRPLLGGAGLDGVDSGVEEEEDERQLTLFGSNNPTTKPIHNDHSYDDEGIDMEQDDEQQGVSLIHTAGEQQWTWNAITDSKLNNSDVDNDSTGANRSDNEEDGATYGPYISSDQQLDDAPHLPSYSAADSSVRQSVEADDEHAAYLHDQDTEMKH